MKYCYKHGTHRTEKCERCHPEQESPAPSCSGGTFVLQCTDEETGEWMDYLKYDRSPIGPCFPHEDYRRIVYYPNVKPEQVAGHIFRMKETLTDLNGGPPIVSQNDQIQL